VRGFGCTIFGDLAGTMIIFEDDQGSKLFACQHGLRLCCCREAHELNDKRPRITLPCPLHELPAFEESK
jgi:hypothetical protein